MQIYTRSKRFQKIPIQSPIEPIIAVTKESIEKDYNSVIISEAKVAAENCLKNSKMPQYWLNNTSDLIRNI